MRDMNYPADKKSTLYISPLTCSEVVYLAGMLDVYVQIQCGQQSYTTRIAPDHTHPAFNEEFALFVFLYISLIQHHLLIVVDCRDLSSDQVIIRLMARKGPEHSARALLEHSKNLFHSSPRRASINGPTQDASLAVITLADLDSDGRDAVVEREYRWQPSLQRRNASGLLRIAFHVNVPSPMDVGHLYLMSVSHSQHSIQEPCTENAIRLFQTGAGPGACARDLCSHGRVSVSERDGS